MLPINVTTWASSKTWTRTQKKLDPEKPGLRKT